jgi:hypothetical protein
MRAAKRWHVWKSIPHTDPTKKARKVPYYTSGIPRNGQLDAPVDVAQLATFEEAASLAGYAGLGFALGGGWQGVDLDGLSQHPELLTIMAQLSAVTYCEVSPNGDGVHAIGYGLPFPSMGSTSDGIEAYAGGRFFTVTGQACGLSTVTDLSGFVESELRPRRGSTASRVPLPPVAAPSWVMASVTPEQVAELRSALLSMRSDDRSLWVDVGMALRALGEQGRGLWMEWSAQSDKFDAADAARTWESLRPTSTDYRAVFAKAQAGGWVNPRLRAIALPPVPEGVDPVALAVEPCDISGSTFAAIDDQKCIFAGCVYVRSVHRVLVPGGDMLDAQRFNATTPYNRFTYMLDTVNEKTTRKAFEALTNSQALVWPQARDTCFRPELPVGHITWDGLVNTWYPIDTPCEAGDVSPFLSHLERMLPVERDRRILLTYMAALVQHPGDKFQWWPLIQSVKGNGKSLILEILEHCVGHRYSFRPNAAEIANGGGKFTGWLRGRVLVGFEEIRTAHKSEVLEILKPIVTNDRLEIQNKGVDQDMGDNRANGVLLTNHKDAVKIDDDERRYCPLFCAQQSKADLARDGMSGDYFPNLYEWARRGGGLAHLNHYLRNYTLERELNPALQNGGKCHRAPDTSSMGEAIAATLGKVEQEVLEAIAEHKQGFCGGWISSIELDNLLREKRLDGLVPRIKRPDMLRGLGYVHHPDLHGGRCSTPTLGGHRPVLYVKDGHLAGQVRGGAAITRAYDAAQLPNVFGIDSAARVA